MGPRAHQAIRQWHHHLALLLAGLCIWMSIADFAENVSVTPPGLSPLLVSGAPATNTPAGRLRPQSVVGHGAHRLLPQLESARRNVCHLVSQSSDRALESIKHTCILDTYNLI